MGSSPSPWDQWHHQKTRSLDEVKGMQRLGAATCSTAAAASCLLCHGLFVLHDASLPATLPWSQLATG